MGTEDGPYRFLDLVGKVINRIDEIKPMYYGLPALISSETKSRMTSLRLFHHQKCQKKAKS